jgi:hypothetical protein
MTKTGFHGKRCEVTQRLRRPIPIKEKQIVGRGGYGQPGYREPAL